MLADFVNGRIPHNSTHLNLSGTGVTDAQLLGHLKKFKDITILDLSNNRGVTDLTVLHGLENLEVIILDNTGVVDVRPLRHNTLVKIKRISLCGTAITNYGDSGFDCLLNLKVLCLGW